MTHTMRRLGIAVIIMLTALMANLTYIQVVKAGDLRHDAHNRRTNFEEFSRARGQITAAGGVVLAQSKPTNDQYLYQRMYPGGPAYANLTGYYSLRYGSTGMERLENDLLAGSDPQLWVDQISDFLTGRDPQGGNVEFTISPTVQTAAYQGLAKQDMVGAVVAIEPKTGAVLALASTPSFDPDPIASHDDETSATAYNEIANASPSPVLDRSIGAVYPPGSTFKLLVAAAALENGMSPDDLLTSAATITLPETGGATLSNYGKSVCANATGGMVPLHVALARSCNTAFAQLAMELGRDTLTDMAEALGIDGEPDKISGYPVVASRIGSMTSPDGEDDLGAIAQSGIGQRDVAVTPMALAQMTATIANGGKQMTPYLLAKTTRPDLSVISTTQPDPATTAISKKTSKYLRDMMIESERYTAGSGQIAGLTIASKTGTAEHGADPKNTPPHAWYVAFAPADDPQIAVAVLVTDGGGRGLDATGGTVAAPIGRSVISAALAGG